MHILLAVSGGIDSMYMAMNASELFEGASLAVAHCNFHLRGSESDGDEAFVRSWCEDNNIPLYVRHFDTVEYARENGISIEMAARDLRYEWFRQLCSEQGFDALAVAHNANDNAETLLLNLLRGTGSRGLRGMGESSTTRGLTILRPLLELSRAEILARMQAKGASWREDSTNSENDCKRNLIRNDVFPLLSQINPSFVRTLNADMQRFAQVDDIAEDYFEQHKEAVLNEDGDVMLSGLLRLRHWKYLLWRLIEYSGISGDEFASLVSSLESNKHIAGKYFGPILVASGRLVLSSSSSSRELEMEIVPRSELPSLKQPEGTLILDADKIGLPLKIREWREGDWMQPLGMRGRKKLSDMMTSLKWSRIQKAETKVIEIDGSHVGALLCCRIDDSLKIGPNTRKVLKIWYK